MITKRLGKTDLQVSVLGFGAAPLGNVYGDVDQAEGERAVHAAIDQGLNFFDVSPLYGNGDTLAEERLGAALLGRRQQVVLASKCGHYRGEAPFDFSRERVKVSLEESLRRLQTETIDLLQAHDIDHGDPAQIIGETLPALVRLREAGKIRFVGITGRNEAFLRQVAEQAEVDTILSFCHYDLVDQALADDLGPFCAAGDIGLISASPLHMALLTVKGPPAWHRVGERLETAARQAAELCAAQGVELSDLAMQFALQNPYAATTLVGMSKERHVARNLQAMETSPNPELLAQVLGLLAEAQSPI